MSWQDETYAFVEVSRNAKGDPQWSIRAVPGTRKETLDRMTGRVLEQWDELEARFGSAEEWAEFRAWKAEKATETTAEKWKTATAAVPKPRSPRRSKA